MIITFIAEEEGEICHSGISVQSSLLFGLRQLNNSVGVGKIDDEVKRRESSAKRLHSEIE